MPPQVLPRGQHVVHRRVLPGQPDHGPDPLRLGHDIAAQYLGSACVRPQQRAQDPDRGGLAGPVRPEQAEDRALGGLEADPVQDAG
jgi:hypothetical protein